MTMTRNHWIVVASFSVAFLVLCYGGYAVLIKPVDDKIAATQVSIDADTTSLHDAEAKEAQYDQFHAERENVRRDLNLISERLDPDLSVREEARVLEKIMNGSGVSSWSIVADIGDRERSKEPGFTSLDQITQAFAIIGGFNELGEICNRIVSNERLLCPESLTISHNDKDDLEDSSLKVTDFNISFYVLPADSGGGK